MPRTDPLPPQWRCLEGLVRCVRQESHKTYTCSCPKCGGDVHPGGELSDRCTLFVDEHPTLYCRRCGLVAYPDQFGDGDWERPSEGGLEAWRQDLLCREKEREEAARRSQQLLNDQQLWQRYYNQLGTYGRQYWEQRGVPSSWQNVWMLGWDDEHRFSVHGNLHITPTATIPLFGTDNTALNIKHRLIHPGSAGKYRYELSGCGQPMFLANPDADYAGHVYVIEGEIKAMVVAVTLDDYELAVAGMPGVKPSMEALEPIQDAEQITLVVDPGARKQAWELSGDLGRERCRVLKPSMKIDDAINEGDMTKRDLQYIFDNALPAGG